MYSTQTDLTAAIIIIAAVLGVIIGYFVLTMIRQQRHNLQLQKANGLAAISAMEKERARIAEDLHDDLGPILSVIKFRVNSVESAEAEEKAELDKASNHLDDVISRMREIANNLMPGVLQRKGLVAAIEELISTVQSKNSLEIRFSHSLTSDIGEDKRLNIYRVIQEVLHNTIKHSKASFFEIFLNVERKNLLLICRDNGVGFDHAKKLKDSEGIGLRSIRNRIDLMNGTMQVESAINKGTAYKFSIPI